MTGGTGTAQAAGLQQPETKAATRSASSTDDRPAVLILNSYHSGYSWSDGELSGILDLFRQQDRHWIPYVEFMDTKHFPEKEHFALLRELYRKKYQSAAIQVVIACDNPALEFALANRDVLAPGAAIVFCGINGYDPRMIAGVPRITGVAENLDFQGTLEIALKLFPKTKAVVVLNDTTVTGLGTRRAFDAVAPHFAGRVRLEVLPDMVVTDLLDRVASLSDDEIVLALSYSRDKAGQVFDLSKFGALLTRKSPVPVFVVHEERLGRGIVGGSVLGGFEHGKVAAGMALQILSGTPISNIPVVKNPTARMMFDHDGLVRFGVPVSSLPAEAIVINEPQSFTHRYKKLVWATGIVVSVLTFFVVGLAIWVGRARKAEAELGEERAFLQGVLDGLPDAVFVLDPNHTVRLRNRSAALLDQEVLVDHSDGSPRPFLHPPGIGCHEAGEPCPVHEVLDQRQPLSFERRRLSQSNLPATFQVSAAPLWKNGEIAGVLASAHDISELKTVYEQLLDHERQLEHIAHHDSLTGLPNRILFLDRFDQAIARSRRSHTTVALLFLDLDRFKNINDTLGHETGDVLLKKVAERLRACVRAEDTVARIGGDEFTILIEESRENSTGVAVARKIIQAFERPFLVGTQELYAGSSIGIAIFPTDGKTVDELIKNADAAMYLAKERGRRNYQFFTESLNDRAHRQMTIESRLRHTLAGDGLEVHFQPIIRLPDRRIVGAEALLRWTDAELGVVAPSEFIPVAEETGLILLLGESVLQKACLAARRWHAIGFSDLRVCVNISARQFWHYDLLSAVRQALSDSNLAARFLELELTESLLLPDSGASIALLRNLRELGVRLALDDFGTGYSSLGYLRKLPLHTLKVAQEFVQDLSPNSNDAAIVRAILSLSKMLGFEVTAEGVETEAHVEFLSANGCEFAQGHYFHKALPAREFEALLLKDEEPVESVWE